MSSVIHYKFKNASKRFDVIAFEGNVLSVSDLKRHIAREKKLGKSEDFDLMITNAQTGEGKRAPPQLTHPSVDPVSYVVGFWFFLCCVLFVLAADYRDEGFLISKNTSVVVRRVPAVRARKVVVNAPEPAPAPAAAAGTAAGPAQPTPTASAASDTK